MKWLSKIFISLGLLAVTGPAWGQYLPIDPQQLRANATAPADANAETANTVSGQVGQRQIAGSKDADKKPMARVDERIENRVQNRLRNRIDRNYDPAANATSPFAVANDKQENAQRPRRR